MFEEFFEHVSIGLALADLTTRFLRVNATYAALTGREPEDLVGELFTSLLHPSTLPGPSQDVERLLSGEVHSLAAEERYLAPDGSQLWVLHGVNLVRDGQGNPGWFAISAQDVTERRRVEQELRELTASLTERAVRDPLTSLVNRTLLEERLRALLARDARSGTATAVLFLDLDGFKAVNDRLGHAVGDQVLRTVAQRLSAGVRPCDTVSRLGGDEFVVLVEGPTDEGLARLVERLAAAVAEPVRAGIHTLEVGVSVGVAVSRGGDTDAASLLAAADGAMYVVKRSRGSSGREARDRRR